jgi:hypothetical protein
VLRVVELGADEIRLVITPAVQGRANPGAKGSASNAVGRSLILH